MDKTTTVSTPDCCASSEVSEKNSASLPLTTALKRVDGAWWVMIAILVLLALIDRPAWLPVVQSMLGNLAHTGVFILFAVFLIAGLRATGAEAIVAKAFQGRESRMIIVAALVGGLAPFCSCEVVPFIAAMLAVGTPISAVMAFWLSSPIMDPAMFVITSGTLGVDFALAKTLAAVCFGIVGGFTMLVLTRTSLFEHPLRANISDQTGSCCGTSNPFEGDINWTFWQEPQRVTVFRETAIENGLFLLKWMALAYLLEVLMIRYIPETWISAVLGGEGVGPIALGALVGGPAYLNGYAAVPLVQGLLNQGMQPGAAMSFMLAGSVTCIPAAVAVWALVKPRVFVTYITLGLSGSFAAGILWAAWV